jgi:hypothetical protein
MGLTIVIIIPYVKLIIETKFSNKINYEFFYTSFNMYGLFLYIKQNVGIILKSKDQF